jgi:YD repeat-containing protein
VTNPLGDTWSYSYNADGEETSVTAPATPAAPDGATTSYTYDSLGNKTSVTNPLGGTCQAL